MRKQDVTNEKKWWNAKETIYELEVKPWKSSKLNKNRKKVKQPKTKPRNWKEWKRKINKQIPLKVCDIFSN